MSSIVNALAEKMHHRRRDRRVLLIEDDDNDAELSIRNLEAAGCAVTRAVTGEQALTMVDDCNYDLFVVDMKLPGISGLIVSRELRMTCPGVPVVISSGSYGDGRELLQAMEDGFVIAPKPFRYENVKLIAQALGPMSLSVPA